MSDAKLVFSTNPKSPQKEGQKNKKTPTKKDGYIYIKYEKKGRKGKGVSIIEGLSLDKNQLKELAFTLKAKCGTGGTIKGSTIEIQGDFREAIKKELEERSYKVKFSGG